MGSTGEYSDRSEWPVRAFLDMAKAADLVVLASARAKAIEQEDDHRYDTHQNEYDQNMKMDYTGTTYFIMNVPLDDTVRMDIARSLEDDGLLPSRGISLRGVPGGAA